MVTTDEIVQSEFQHDSLIDRCGSDTIEQKDPQFGRIYHWSEQSNKHPYSMGHDSFLLVAGTENPGTRYQVPGTLSGRTELPVTDDIREIFRTPRCKTALLRTRRTGTRYLLILPDGSTCYLVPGTEGQYSLIIISILKTFLPESHLGCISRSYTGLSLIPHLP